MRLSLHYWTYSTPAEPEAIGPTLRETARIAEQAAGHAFSVMDHFFQMDRTDPAEQPTLEAYTTLGHAAAVTERMPLGVLVTGVMYRYPGLLAKTVTTLDVLSDGRARPGIGASWYEREHRGLGVPGVPVAERFERLEETLCVPQPLQRPHPPILIGGGGEQKTLLLVARYADACNLFGAPPQEIERKLDVPRRHCDAEGRDYDRITKTVLAQRPPLDDVDAFLDDAREYGKLGVTEVMVMPDRHPVEFATGLAERVLPRLADGDGG